MNDYAYEDISIGVECSFSHIITTEMMDGFRVVSGDINPLHVDKGYARSLGHPDVVVYGMLTASLYSTLAGVHLPGRRSLLLEVDSKCRNPVYVGDELKVCGAVKRMEDLFNVIEIGASIINQHGIKVSSAKIRVQITDDGGNALDASTNALD